MRPDTIRENGNLSRFTYNSDGDRVRMRITRSDTLSLDRFYVGDGYEMNVNNSGTTERLYLGG
jgi:YD repeat-containing protein